MHSDLRAEAEREMLAWVVRYAALGFTPMNAIFYTCIEIVRSGRVAGLKESGAVRPELRAARVDLARAEAEALVPEDG